MENLVVSTFKDAQKATEALDKLKALDQLGDITIYNIAMIRKKNEKEFEILHHEGPDFDEKPVAGALVGSAVGAIGGPVGLAIGMLSGTMVGAADEGESMSFAGDFLDKVNSKISTGTFAIILDVEEDSEFMINSYMEPYNGQTLHRNISDEYDDFNQKQWDDLNKEIDDQEKSLKMALDKDKAAIHAKLDQLKQKRKARLEMIKARAERKKKNIREKIKALDERIKALGTKVSDKLKAQKNALEKYLGEYEDDISWAYSVPFV